MKDIFSAMKIILQNFYSINHKATQIPSHKNTANIRKREITAAALSSPLPPQKRTFFTLKKQTHLHNNPQKSHSIVVFIDSKQQKRQKNISPCQEKNKNLPTAIGNIKSQILNTYFKLHFAIFNKFIIFALFSCTHAHESDRNPRLRNTTIY